jgi:hypothetical protein
LPAPQRSDNTLADRKKDDNARTDPADPEDLQRQLDREIEKLRNWAEVSLDPCIRAQLVAISDAAVREVLLTKLGEGRRFIGLCCLSEGCEPEQTGVLFSLDCPPGPVICLVDPSFLVRVDLRQKAVVTILDPYLPVEPPGGFPSFTPAGALPFSMGVPCNSGGVQVTECDRNAGADGRGVGSYRYGCRGALTRQQRSGLQGDEPLSHRSRVGRSTMRLQSARRQ